MSRSTPLLAVGGLALGCVILMIALMSALSAAARAPTPDRAAAATAFRPPYVYCYNWDFPNLTGYEATGARWRISDLQAPTAVYTGALNPFGAPDASSGYDAGSNTYRFHFSDGVASEADRVHVGLCTDLPKLRLGTVATPTEWLSATLAVTPAPLFAGVEFTWLDRDQVQITLVNEQAVTMTLEVAHILDTDWSLPLDDLYGDVANVLPIATELITEPWTLAPNAAQLFAVTLPAINRPIVLEVIMSEEADPANTVHLIAQTVAPGLELFTPVLSR